MARIMLCDDSKLALEMLEKKFLAAGYEVVAKAHDGEEGVKLYVKHEPDLSLVDVTMPNKDGRECLENILEINPAAKIIMVTALKDEAIASACLEVGAKAFLSKEKFYRDDVFRSQVLPIIENVLSATTND
jgi:two-component system chemotaxis response regulator CheY